MAVLSPEEGQHVALVDLVDRILNKGVVITGEVTISVADVELVELALQLVLGGSGTLRQRVEGPKTPAERGRPGG